LLSFSIIGYSFAGFYLISIFPPKNTYLYVENIEKSLFIQPKWPQTWSFGPVLKACKAEEDVLGTPHGEFKIKNRLASVLSRSFFEI
jgi:hypothetical protein